jgi:hypothetical protein
MYKGTAPKKTKKPSPPPTRPSQAPEANKMQKPSYRRPAKDPLYGLREAKEEQKMIKFQPKPVEDQKPKKPALEKKPVPVAKEKEAKSTETEEGTSIEQATPEEQQTPSKPPPPDPLERPPPNSTSRPIPAAPPPPNRIRLFASAASVLFLGGVIIYRNRSQIPFLSPSKTSPDAAPKTKDLSASPALGIRRGASLAKAIEVLSDVFGERCSTLTEDLVDFGGEGILGLGEGKLPTAVVWPVSTEEVEVILKVADTYRIPVIPYSGGTSLEGYRTTSE